MFKDKRISAIFTVVFTFLLIMVVFVIAKSDFGKTKKHQELSAEDIESLVAAGDFLSPSLRSVDDSDVFLGKKNADVELMRICLVIILLNLVKLLIQLGRILVIKFS
jgi:hypothetical protein